METPGNSEGDASSLIAAVLAGSETDLAAELEPAVEAFIGNAVFRYVAEEAIVAVIVTALFFGIAFASPYLPDPTWAPLMKSLVLLWYIFHFLQGVARSWPLARAVFLLRGAPLFRFALFVLARKAILVLEGKIAEIGRVATFVPRAFLSGARYFYRDDRDRVALALADALVAPVRREILWTLAVGLLPMLVVLFGFRSALTWGAAFQGAAHLSWWELLLLPFRQGVAE